MPVPDRATIRRLYTDGVDAVVDIASLFSYEDWSRPACGHWNGAELARHVLGVVDWYHQWLDRAIAGDDSQPFALSQLDAQNDIEVQARDHLDGPAAIERFAQTANAYLLRITDEVWDISYGYPFGIATAGLHAGAAATEWHIHAWDLASSVNTTHVPGEPGALFRAVGWCRTADKGGIAAARQGLSVDAGSRIRPWPNLLRLSGRT